MFLFSEVTYMVHVFTGDKSGAGTDANVFLTIYGESEDSGKWMKDLIEINHCFFFFIGERELAKSKTNRNKFEQKQVCFVIDN